MDAFFLIVEDLAVFELLFVSPDFAVEALDSAERDDMERLAASRLVKVRVLKISVAVMK